MKSEICTLDIASGEVALLLTCDGIVEAPNWHRDGYLLVNSGGLLWRVPLDAPRLEPVGTGPLSRLNNDHGLSPGHDLVALSDSTESGGSCIYLMPLAGGAPRRVTALTPSWWHGWSPDGARIAYAAVREAGGPVGIWSCAIDGSGEACVTAAFDHADGPDYSADGAWIWFNGERDGSVDLWRIRPDGSDLQRMTGGDSVDWFPHPSPDGAHVVYLAYPAGTQGHPFGRDVELRLMPQGGGPSRGLAAFRGGQGTINVPSWAPDSRAFAFVRFRDD